MLPKTASNPAPKRAAPTRTPSTQATQPSGQTTTLPAHAARLPGSDQVPPPPVRAFVTPQTTTTDKPAKPRRQGASGGSSPSSSNGSEYGGASSSASQHNEQAPNRAGELCNALKLALCGEGAADFNDVMQAADRLGGGLGKLQVSYRLIARSLVDLQEGGQNPEFLESFFNRLEPHDRFGITFELQEFLRTDEVPEGLQLHGLSVLETARVSLAKCYQQQERKLVESAMELRSALLGLPANIAQNASAIAPRVHKQLKAALAAVQRLKTFKTALELTGQNIATLTRQLTGLVNALNSCPPAVYEAMTDSQRGEMRHFLAELKADPKTIDDVIYERRQAALANSMLDALLAKNLPAALTIFAQARSDQQTVTGRSRDHLPAFFNVQLQQVIADLNPADREHLAVDCTPQARELKDALTLLQKVPAIQQQPVLLGTLIALQDVLAAAAAAAAAGRALGSVAPGAPPEPPLVSLSGASEQVRQALGVLGIAIDSQGACVVKSGQVHAAVQRDVASNLEKTLAGQGLKFDARGIAAAFMEHIGRAHLTIDGQPLIATQGWNFLTPDQKETRKAEAIEKLRLLASGNAALATAMSAVANTNAFFPIAAATMSSQSFVRLPDGTPGKLLGGEEQVFFDFRRDATGAVVVACRWQTRDATRLHVTDGPRAGQKVVLKEGTSFLDVSYEVALSVRGGQIVAAASPVTFGFDAQIDEWSARFNQPFQKPDPDKTESLYGRNADQERLQAVRDHLLAEHSSENIDFIIAVNRFNRSENETTTARLLIADEIAAAYIARARTDAEAPSSGGIFDMPTPGQVAGQTPAAQVNISAFQATAIRDALSMPRTTESDRVAALRALQSALDAAYLEVAKLVTSDPIGRLLGKLEAQVQKDAVPALPVVAATPPRKPALPPERRPSPSKARATAAAAHEGAAALRDLDKAWELEAQPATPKAPVTPEVKASPARTVKEIEAERAGKLPGQIASGLVKLAAPLAPAGSVQSSLKSLQLLSNWARATKSEKSKLTAYLQAGLADLNGPQLAQLRKNLDSLTPAERSDPFAALVLAEVSKVPVRATGVNQQTDYALAHVLSGRKFDATLLLRELASLPLQELIVFREKAVARNLQNVAAAADATAWPESNWWAEPGAADQYPEAFVSSVTALVSIFSDPAVGRSAAMNGRALAGRLKAALDSTQFTGGAYGSEQLIQLRSALGRLGVRATDPVSISLSALINNRLITSPGPRLQARPVTPVAVPPVLVETRRKFSEYDERRPPPPPPEDDEPSPGASQTPSLIGASRSTAATSTGSSPPTRNSLLTEHSSFDSEASGYRISGSSTPTASSSTSVSSSTPNPGSGSTSVKVRHSWLAKAARALSRRKASPPTLTIEQQNARDLGEALAKFAGPIDPHLGNSGAWSLIRQMQDRTKLGPISGDVPVPQEAIESELSKLSDSQMVAIWANLFGPYAFSSPEELASFSPIVKTITDTISKRLSSSFQLVSNTLTPEFAAMVLAVNAMDKADRSYRVLLAAADRANEFQMVVASAEDSNRTLVLNALAHQLQLGRLTPDEVAQVLAQAPLEHRGRNAAVLPRWVEPQFSLKVRDAARSAVKSGEAALRADLGEKMKALASADRGPQRADVDFDLAKIIIELAPLREQYLAYCESNQITDPQEIEASSAELANVVGQAIDHLALSALPEEVLPKLAAALRGLGLPQQASLVDEAVESIKGRLADGYNQRMSAMTQALAAHDFAAALRSHLSAQVEIRQAVGRLAVLTPSANHKLAETEGIWRETFIKSQQPEELNALRGAIEQPLVSAVSAVLGRVKSPPRETNLWQMVDEAKNFLELLHTMREIAGPLMSRQVPGPEPKNEDVRLALAQGFGLEISPDGHPFVVAGFAEDPVQRTLKTGFQELNTFARKTEFPWITPQGEAAGYQVSRRMLADLTSNGVSYIVGNGGQDEPGFKNTSPFNEGDSVAFANRMFDLTRTDENPQGHPLQMRTLSVLANGHAVDQIRRLLAGPNSPIFVRGMPGNVDGETHLTCTVRRDASSDQLIAQFELEISNISCFTPVGGLPVPVEQGASVRLAWQMSVDADGAAPSLSGALHLTSDMQGLPDARPMFEQLGRQAAKIADASVAERTRFINDLSEAVTTYAPYRELWMRMGISADPIEAFKASFVELVSRRAPNSATRLMDGNNLLSQGLELDALVKLDSTMRAMGYAVLADLELGKTLQVSILRDTLSAISGGDLADALDAADQYILPARALRRGRQEGLQESLIDSALDELDHDAMQQVVAQMQDGSAQVLVQTLNDVLNLPGLVDDPDRRDQIKRHADLLRHMRQRVALRSESPPNPLSLGPGWNRSGDAAAQKLFLEQTEMRLVAANRDEAVRRALARYSVTLPEQLAKDRAVDQERAAFKSLTPNR